MALFKASEARVAWEGYEQHTRWARYRKSKPDVGRLLSLIMGAAASPFVRVAFCELAAAAALRSAAVGSRGDLWSIDVLCTKRHRFAGELLEITHLPTTYRSASKE